jgi:site-specific DNA-cytosine methylase
VPNSKTRRGRVGKGVAQTLDTACNQGVMVGDYRADEGFRWREDGNSPTICARAREDGSGQLVIQYGNQGVIQLNPSKESGGQQPYQQNRVYDINGINPALNSGQEIWGGNIINTYKIRRLTPRECFRLMDFPETFTWPVSDSQAYKQAGNSIVVNVLYKIIKNLKL